MTEHCRTVHRYAINAIPVSGFREGTGGVGGDTVAGVGENKSGGGKVKSGGGRKGRGRRVTKGM